MGWVASEVGLLSLHCWLLCCTSLSEIEVRDPLKIIWGWWRPTTPRYPTTTTKPLSTTVKPVTVSDELFASSTTSGLGTGDPWGITADSSQADVQLTSGSPNDSTSTTESQSSTTSGLATDDLWGITADSSQTDVQLTSGSPNDSTSTTESQSSTTSGLATGDWHITADSSQADVQLTLGSPNGSTSTTESQSSTTSGLATDDLWSITADSSQTDEQLTSGSPNDSTSSTYLTATTESQSSTTDVTSTSELYTTGAMSTTNEFTEETTSAETKFAVYWNVPTFQCHKYGLNFSRVSDWGIQQNHGDNFRGEAIAILYDPGEFPALLPASGGDRVPRNGGVPQEASLDRHLALFKQHLDKLVPDSNFSGLGIIDFEHWRPVWRQMWGSLAVYRDYSRIIERRRNPYWFSSIIESQASFKYELAARTFMLETLRLAKKLRPKAKWGYYGYPFCFNYTPNNNKATCSEETRRENDQMWWMFGEVTSYYPSLYLKERDMYPWKRLSFIEGRLSESMRVAKEAPVYPYVWYKYHDTSAFLNEEDMRRVLWKPAKWGCQGAVIWGASRDVNSRQKCHALADYLEKVLGPAVRALKNGSFRQLEDPDSTTPLSEDYFFAEGFEENVPLRQPLEE